MSEKQEQDKPNVSRETTDDPVATLNEILDRSTPSILEPPEKEPSSKGPAEAENVLRETPEPERSTSPTEKNKRSSVYVYLAILFGAAFLMLLLAYFVQQRNNETVLDDLRSTTASRQELLEDIQRLEEENETLRAEQKETTDKLLRANMSLEESSSHYGEMTDLLTGQRDRATVLAYLERFHREGDSLMSAIIVEECDKLFNKHNKDFEPEDDSIDTFTFPISAPRYMELREAIFDTAGCMTVEQFTITEDWSEYTERPYINAPSLYDDETVETARALWDIFFSYPYAPGLTTDLIMDFYQTDNLERLNSGAFQPSTVALLEQIEADLIAHGWLKKNEDGTVNFSYASISIP